MMPSKNLQAFLKQHLVSQGNKQDMTHTRIGDSKQKIPGGSFSIKQENMDEFLNLYYKEVFTNKKNEYLTERQTDSSPILIDIDLRYDESVTERQHTEEHIKEIIFVYLKQFTKTFKLIPNSEFTVFVFEKPHVNCVKESGLTKDGIHIIFGIRCLRQTQNYLRNKVASDLQEVLADLPVTNTIDDINDSAIACGRNNWMMFGSKKPGNEAYKLSYCYNCLCQEHNSIPGCVDDFELSDAVKETYLMEKNFRKLLACYPDNIYYEPSDEYIKDMEALASKANQGKRSKQLVVAGGNSRSSSRTTSSSSVMDINYSLIRTKDDLEALVTMWYNSLSERNENLREIHNLTMIIPEEYYRPGSYDKWIRVGWALKNTSESLLLTWLMFSSQSSGFNYATDIEDIVSRWNDFKSDDGNSNAEIVTAGSIKYWARENRAAYDKVMQSSLNGLIDNSIRTDAEHYTDHEVAQVLYKMYSGTFVCSSISKGEQWYEYVGHGWKQMDSAATLRIKLSSEVSAHYLARHRELLSQLTSLMDEPTDESNANYIKALKSKVQSSLVISTKLKQNSNKVGIMKEARDLFYNRDFNNKIDTDPYLLGFKNGVIDFKNKCFRDGAPDDYLTLNTNISYKDKSEIPNYDAISKDIIEFMEKLFPVPELREYMWEHLAASLVGTNKDQTFNIYTGEGSNGKSLLVKLMQTILGDYKGSVPITLITQKRGSIGSTSSEVAQLKGIRYAVIQEPSRGDTLNEGILKEITGGDPIQARSLYANSITFTPQFSLVVCTNTLLDVKSNDNGTWRRIRVAPFQSTFVDTIKDPTIKNQFKKDETLEDKFDIWTPVLMYMLVQRAFANNGITPSCKMVEEQSETYRNSQDVVTSFFTDKLVEDENGSVQKREITECFKQWHMATYMKPPANSKELFERMEKKFGKYPKRGGWRGIRLSDDDDDEGDGIANDNNAADTPPSQVPS